MLLDVPIHLKKKKSNTYCPFVLFLIIKIQDHGIWKIQKCISIEIGDIPKNRDNQHLNICIFTKSGCYCTKWLYIFSVTFAQFLVS